MTAKGTERLATDILFLICTILAALVVWIAIAGAPTAGQ